MSVHVVVINGTGGSGKDTFVEQCMNLTLEKNGYFIKNISSVDKVKEAAMIVGWNGAKEEKDRKFLSDFKQLVQEYNNNCFEYMKDQYDDLVRSANETNLEAILFLHIREIHEIKKAVEMFNAKTLLVYNNRVKQIVSNESDANVFRYDYDYIILNDSTISELEKKAAIFMANIFHDTSIDQTSDFEPSFLEEILHKPDKMVITKNNRPIVI